MKRKDWHKTDIDRIEEDGIFIKKDTHQEMCDKLVWFDGFGNPITKHKGKTVRATPELMVKRITEDLKKLKAQMETEEKEESEYFDELMSND